MSTAEILFNDSVFALLPGQETFVKSKVLIAGMGAVGWGGAGWREEETGVMGLIFGLAREAVGGGVRPVAGGVGCWEGLTLELRELSTSLRCISSAVPFLFFLP